MADSDKKKHSAGRIWLNWFFKLFKDLRFRNQLYVFFVCLLIAIFIWLSIKLSKDYKTSIQHPVEYINLPQDKILTNDPPDRVYLEVNGRGTELLKARLRESNTPIRINLGQVQFNSIDKSKHKSEVPTVWFLSQIARQSKYYDNLVDIDPDTLVFEFEDLRYKKVPVSAQLNYKLDNQVWFRKSVTIIPDSVVVSGITSAVDTLQSVPTQQIDLGIIKKSHRMKVKLQEFSSRFLKMESDSVQVKIPAEKYTEAQIEIPIHANTSRGISLKTFPEKVQITYRVSLEDYEKVSSSMFRAEVTYKPTSKQFLDVEIARSPSYVRITEVNPEETEYILLQ